ncbi:MAG: hypothetical protein ABSH35_35075 [Isosphaeraceae bacterium]
MYLCATDEETVAHARAGNVIARETPTDAELGTEYAEIAPGLTLPLAWLPGTPEQEVVRLRRAREQAINDAIRLVRYASRGCPGVPLSGAELPGDLPYLRVCGGPGLRRGRQPALGRRA